MECRTPRDRWGEYKEKAVDRYAQIIPTHRYADRQSQNPRQTTKSMIGSVRMMLAGAVSAAGLASAVSLPNITYYPPCELLPRASVLSEQTELILML